MRTRLLSILALFAALGVIAEPAGAEPWILCGNTWTNACASASFSVEPEVVTTLEGDKTVYKLIIVLRNQPLGPGDPGYRPSEGDASESVITRFLIQAVNAEGTPLHAFDFEAAGGEWPPTADPLPTWSDGWDLNQNLHKKKGFQQFTLIGFDWTQEIKNAGGSCIGIVPDGAFSRACAGDGRDHREFAQFTLFFEEVPIVTNWASQVQVIDASNPCTEFGCESDWTVVPEPITMILIGTGLAGIGGVAALRRRRENELGKE